VTFPFVGPVEVPAPTADTHPATKLYVDDALDGFVPTHPLVPNPPVALTYAATLTPDASAGNYRVCTATGAVALQAPSSPTNGQMLRIRFIASGGARTVTFDSALKRPSTIASTLVIATGKRGDVGLLYETADSAWTVLAAQAQA